jgi:hypothetical protein
MIPANPNNGRDLVSALRENGQINGCCNTDQLRTLEGVSPNNLHIVYPASKIFLPTGSYSTLDKLLYTNREISDPLSFPAHGKAIGALPPERPQLIRADTFS